MIEIDGGDQREVRVDQIDRIEPPAHPDFQHPGIAAGGAKHLEGRERAELEEGQRHFTARRLDALEAHR